MAGQVIKPDLGFVKDIIAGGGESLKKCYQCATCSVVCNITPDDKPFPRKEMIYAQWGLKDRLVSNPDVWLCHQCNDCTAYCPRGAKPGEVLSAIRKESIKHYAFPGFMARAVSDKRFLPLLFIFPAVLFLIVLSAIGTLGIPEGEIVFSKFFPVLYIDIIFTSALGFGVFVGIMGIRRFWRDMNKAGGYHRGNFKDSLIATLKEVLTHSRFKSCIENKNRYLSHIMVFYGFIALGITTALAAFYLYVLKIESPYPLTSPVKIIGTIGGLALFVGINLVVINRIRHAKRLGIGSYSDWLLIFIIYVVTLSGILSKVTRLADMATLAYSIYFIHLVFVLSLFLYLPYSKLAHLFYRATAICYAKYSGRDVSQRGEK